jgi:hypothetical protein
MIITRIRTTVLGGATAVVLLAGSAASAAAHSQIVQPPSHDEPVVTGPISRPWAQAHCHAASPALVDDASNGVVAFPPGAALPCPPVENPGGQVHGD